jgi:type IX secretion system PorP/SprF family membrane protein
MIKAILRTGYFIRMLFIILWISALCDASGQNTPEYLKYYSYEQVINPAATGRDRYPFVNFSNKKYWLSTRNSPYEICLGGAFRLGHINFYTPTMMLNKYNFFSRDRMGFGGFLMYEQNGPMGYLFTEFSYGYHIPLNENSTTELSFGLSLQLSDYNINTNMLDPMDSGDPELLALEKVPPVFDGGFGVYFNTEQFFAGASANDLLRTEYDLETDITEPNRRDIFLQSGYKFYLHRFELEPSILGAWIDDDPLYFSGQLKAYYKDYNWISIGYMSTQSMRLAAGLRVGRIHFVYAFEQSISKMAKYFSNSHEIMIGLNIGLFEPKGLRKTVRRRP